MRKEHIYFMVLFTDGHRDFTSTTLPLWKVLHLYYDQNSIKVVKMITREEYYANVGN